MTTDEFNQAALQWHDALVDKARSFGLPLAEAQDAMQDGLLAMWQRGLEVVPAADAYKVMLWWVGKRALNAKIWQDAGKPAETEWASDLEPEPTPEEAYLSQEAAGERLRRRAAVRAALFLLTPRQLAVVCGIRLGGLTEEQMAKRLGVTHQAVHQVLDRAENKLRGELADWDPGKERRHPGGQASERSAGPPQRARTLWRTWRQKRNG